MQILGDFGNSSVVSQTSSIGTDLFKSSSFSNILGKAIDVGTTALSMTLGLDSQYSQLLQQQMIVQEQMQRVSLESNIIKSRHETDMSVIRNTRVG